MFDDITVLCEETDGFLEAQVHIVQSDTSTLLRWLQNEDLRHTIGYGDFCTAESFADVGLPFYFTYHDNWPELGQLTEPKNKDNNQLEAYAKIFTNAEAIFSVSEQKLPFIRQYTDRVYVVRNGLSQPVRKHKANMNNNGPYRVLMAGNIGSRKYKYAVEVFDILEAMEPSNIQIDICGNVEDESILRQLHRFPFLNFLGFQKGLSYDEYDLYLNTSSIENLSLSVVDALANHTPVMAFDVGGLDEVITNQTGLLIEPYDVEAFAEELLRVSNRAVDFTFDQQDLSDFDWSKSGSRMLEIMMLSQKAEA